MLVVFQTKTSWVFMQARTASGKHLVGKSNVLAEKCEMSL